MSLPNIVQILCLEQRQVGLTVKCQSELGAIYFDRGDIIHATVGSLEGEDAVFQMLSWPDGFFRVGELIAPHRTINARWDQLMMEGAKRRDEFERDHGADPANLEQSRCRLSDKSTLKRPAVALQLLLEMANETIVATTDALAGEDRVKPLKSILSEIAKQFPTAQSLAVQNERLSVTLNVNLFNSVEKKVRQQFFSDACRSIVELMDAYFAHMTSRFRSAPIGEGLKEAYIMFLIDLSRAVGAVRV